MRNWQPGTNRDARLVLDHPQNWQSGGPAAGQDLRQVGLVNANFVGKPALIRVFADPLTEPKACMHGIRASWHNAKRPSRVFFSFFATPPTSSMVRIYCPHAMCQVKAERILLENIRALMAERGIDNKTLAFAVGHSEAWISKILSGDRKMKLSDIDRVSDFFGLTAAQMLEFGIAPLLERRRRERRSGEDRRKQDRRAAHETERPFRRLGIPLQDDDEDVA